MPRRWHGTVLAKARSVEESSGRAKPSRAAALAAVPWLSTGMLRPGVAPGCLAPALVGVGVAVGIIGREIAGEQAGSAAQRYRSGPEMGPERSYFLFRGRGVESVVRPGGP